MPDVNDLNEKLSTARRRYQQNRQTLLDRQSVLRRIAGAAGDVPLIIGKFAAAPSATDQPAFRPQFVEPLLQQASGLVDRVLAEDATYRQLRIDQLNLRLDLDELERLQAINDDEVEKGLFHVPFWEASASLESDKALKKAQTDLVAFVKSNAERQAQLAGWATENAQQPLATGWEGKLSQHTLRLFNGYSAPADQVPSGAVGTAGNIIGGIISHEASSYALSYTQAQLAAQQGPVDARAIPLEKRVAYLDADAGFKERRKITAHQKLMDKLDAVQTPHAPLNYADRLAAIEQRAAVDLRQAYQRLIAVRTGMALIYGLTVPELPSIPVTPLKEDDFDFLNRLVAWVRHAGLALQRIYDNDQDVVVSLSVAERLKHEHFHEGRKRGYWEFDIEPAHFADFKLVRLRGVSAVSHSTDRSYSFILTPPRDCGVLHGPTRSLTEIALDIDPCWLGQVTSSRSLRPDICGTRVLWNASPIGRWSLRIAPGTSASELDDLRLNFHIATQRLL
jgi:hypothetical protein